MTDPELQAMPDVDDSEVVSWETLGGGCEVLLRGDVQGRRILEVSEVVGLVVGEYEGEELSHVEWQEACSRHFGRVPGAKRGMPVLCFISAWNDESVLDVVVRSKKNLEVRFGTLVPTSKTDASTSISEPPSDRPRELGDDEAAMDALSDPDLPFAEIVRLLEHPSEFVRGHALLAYLRHELPRFDENQVRALLRRARG